MSTDWIPFGKPIQYNITRSQYYHHQCEGWIIAWRLKEAFHGIEYLLPNGRTFGITCGEQIVFLA